MNARSLAYGTAFYGIMLLFTAGFSLWSGSTQSAIIFLIPALGALFWAHYLNRKQYWSFSGLLMQLFITAALLGLNVMYFFKGKMLATRENITDLGFIIYSAAFFLTTLLIIIAARTSTRIRQESE